MKSTVEQLSPTRVKLNVEVPFEELSGDFDRAYRSLAQQIRIPGFRPGKAPAKLIEARVGRDSILAQVVNDAIPGKYSQAVAETETKAIGQPEIEVTKLEDNEELVFTAEVDVHQDQVGPGAGSGLYRSSKCRGRSDHRHARSLQQPLRRSAEGDAVIDDEAAMVGGLHLFEGVRWTRAGHSR